MKRTFGYVFILCVMNLLLTACGQSGRLYLVHEQEKHSESYTQPPKYRQNVDGPYNAASPT